MTERVMGGQEDDSIQAWDLSSDSQHPHKNTGMLTRSCNPNTAEVERGGFLELSAQVT